jgi:hypothetical protein
VLIMRPGHMKLLSLEDLQRLHVNCLDVLMRPQDPRRSAAERLLPQIHLEFGDRSREPDGFTPMLRTMGYHVRNMGLTELHRRFVLKRLVFADLPSLNDAEYMRPWAEPGTVERCRTLRREIRKYLTRYGNRPYMRDAVERWREDILYVEELGLQIADTSWPT